MQKLEQTKQVANQQISQLEDVASETKGELEAKQMEVNSLRNQVTNMPQQYTKKITDLTEERDKWKKEYERLQGEYNWKARVEAEEKVLLEKVDPRKHVG